MTVSLLVVDDCPLVRAGIAAVFLGDPDVRVAGEAADGRQALELARALSPEVVTVEPVLDGGTGLALVRRLAAEAPATRALVFSADETPEALLDALGHGAAGYLTKRADPDELRHAVVAVASGGSVIPGELAGDVLRAAAAGRLRRRIEAGSTAPRLERLSRSERELVGLVGRGLTDAQIALGFGVSSRTVQARLARIRRKTGVRRRSELVRWAIEHSVTPAPGAAPPPYTRSSSGSMSMSSPSRHSPSGPRS
jgi:DNA-binding NarL/FixJ family response regulator